MTIPTTFYQPRSGYTSATVHDEYYEQNPMTAVPVDTSNEYNLTGGDDPRDPLHFWQLYSLIGEEPIVAIITDFYQRVFADNDVPWFRDAFTNLAPLEYHIAAQAAYWIDAMGGGRRYHGGEYRLHFHHKHNAAVVMTAEGASRWMYHMQRTLRHFRKVLDDRDPRVRSCILEFLRTKMKTYAHQFGWDFNESEMEMID